MDVPGLRENKNEIKERAHEDSTLGPQPWLGATLDLLWQDTG